MKQENLSEDVSGRLAALDTRIAADCADEEALIERGRLYWTLGRRGEAINDYLAAQKLNPEGNAKELLRATYEILNFYHKDLYNP